MSRSYRLTGPDGRSYASETPGLLGGNTLREKIYGRLDCPAALRALRQPGNGYRRRRVFFADEATAVRAGFRPCGACMRESHRAWKEGRLEAAGP